jgi:hypothetical protein
MPNRSLETGRALGFAFAVHIMFLGWLNLVCYAKRT